MSNGCKAVHTARRKLVQRAAKEGLVLRQSCARVGKQLLFKHGRSRHTKQFKRAQKALKSMRNRLCRQGLSREYPLVRDRLGYPLREATALPFARATPHTKTSD